MDINIDELIKNHRQVARPNEDPFLLNKGDNTGFQRTLKTSALKIKYRQTQDGVNKAKSLSFSKLNGYADNKAIPTVAVMLSELIDNSVVEVMDVTMQSTFGFTAADGGDAFYSIANERKQG